MLSFGAVIAARIPAHAQQTALATLQNSQALSSSAAGGPHDTPLRTVRGRVQNGLDGSAIARALVTLNGRAVLSGPEGQFEFLGFADPVAYASVTKPGYGPSADGDLPVNLQLLASSDEPVSLKLYPEGLITGSVTASDGVPASHVQVVLKRASFDTGELRWAAVAFASTDSRGDFRFAQPPGRYRLSSAYLARRQDDGQAVLPTEFPEQGESDASRFSDLRSGEELHVDLRPRTGPIFPVRFRVEVPDGQRGLNFSAITAAGQTMFLQCTTRTGGIYECSLPAGTYRVRARLNSRELQMAGTAQITVAVGTASEIPIHPVPFASLPIDLLVSAASATPPSTGLGRNLSSNGSPANVRMFNLRLHDLEAGEDYQQVDIVPHQRDDQTWEFLAPPGRYRLEANQNGGWSIDSATSGITDLSSGELVVGPATGGFPIKIAVSNSVGFVQGTLSEVPSNGVAFIYIFPKKPSLATLQPTIVANANLHFGLSLPAGSYTAIAVERKLQEDLHNPDLPGRFLGAVPFEVTAFGQNPLTLPMAHEKATTP